MQIEAAADLRVGFPARRATRGAGQGGAARFFHGGSNEGYRCHIEACLLTGQGAAVMTNSDAGQRVADLTIREIERAFEWPKRVPIGP